MAIAVWTGQRLYVNGQRLVEGLDWMAVEPGALLLRDELLPTPAGSKRLVLETPGAADQAYLVSEVKSLGGARGSPWKLVSLRELNLMNEFTAAVASLPE